MKINRSILKMFMMISLLTSMYSIPLKLCIEHECQDLCWILNESSLPLGDRKSTRLNSSHL